MRKVAGISFSHIAASPTFASALFSSCLNAVESWLSSKGVADEALTVDNFRLIDGRIATLSKSLDTIAGGQLLRVQLQEPSDSARFETHLTIGVHESQVGAFFELRVGAAELGAPVRFDARVPRVVRDIIGLTGDWNMATTPVVGRAVTFSGTDEGNDLVRLLWHADRAMPVVVVSDYDGVLLSPGIQDALARDLAGVALVVRADRDCCWQLSAVKGVDWSCYNGAIRLYYPRIGDSPSPRQHPLWTPSFLLRDDDDPDHAARRLRGTLRRSCLSFSAFSTYVAPPLATLEAEAAAERFAEARTAAAADHDWEELERLYARENDRLQLVLTQRDAEIRDLRVQLANLQTALQWKEPEEHDSAPPVQAAPPATVREAVDRAQAEFSDHLLFGDDVNAATDRLIVDAGPPEKVFLYFQELASLGRARQGGQLGTSMKLWLQQRGVNASGESETVTNSRAEMSKRTFHDGEKKRAFELHLKPSDHVSQDRCVRIYFDYDDAIKRVVIGYVGPHL